MKRILLLFTFLFSFTVHSAVYKVTSFSGMPGCKPFSVGQLVKLPSPACNGVTYKDRYTVYTIESLIVYNGNSSLGAWMCMSPNSGCKQKNIGNVVYQSESCPDDLELDPVTGICEEPPPPSFCDSPEIEEKRQAEMEMCTNIGGEYHETCTNDPEEWLPECRNVPEPECEEGSPDWPQCADVPKCNANNPNWPACLWPPEPDTPDNPDFDSNNPPSTNEPSPDIDPSPETPPVDVLPPDEGNGNILKAIANLNKDNNELITRLNKDLNVGLSDNTEHIKKLNDNTIGFWQDSINGFNNVNQSINNQNDVIRQSSSSTNNYLSTLISTTKKGSDSIVDAIQKASEKDKIIDVADVPADDLYTDNSFNELNEDVANLKTEYQEQLNKFKSYFNFQTDVNSGDYNAHTLKQNWGGKELTFDNFALTVFVDNADIIGLIIIFGFGVAGIRIILETV
ncbi:hypothetical protein [Aliivibrio sp. EL58]|uniref:hypothetical protein n=1 Tax=Aliivibrio sp. EL58 TaxID=2107582 RepID=UPI000EFA3B2E|nr:hypothetical protein [Aliivibrio sp. EL58]